MLPGAAPPEMNTLLPSDDHAPVNGFTFSTRLFPVSETYTFPAESVATPIGFFSVPPEDGVVSARTMGLAHGTDPAAQARMRLFAGSAR